jgi:hypothetical protein
MRKAFVLASVLLLVGAVQVSAYWPAVSFDPPLHYDPYYVLPGQAGGLGIDAGLSSPDIGSLGDVTDIFAMGKYSISDQLEVGVLASFGFLWDTGWWEKDPLSAIVVGAKYGLTEQSAVTANLTPLNEIEELGLSLGYMQTMQLSNFDLSGHLQVGLLDGYAPEGVGIDLMIEPSMAINERLTGYLDFLIRTNTDDIGDYLAINLWPNVDYAVMEGLVINAGVTLGLGGDLKQEDVGLMVTAIKTIVLE